eukprot:4336845-Prymnesium_polylepis.1
MEGCAGPSRARRRPVLQTTQHLLVAAAASRSHANATATKWATAAGRVEPARVHEMEEPETSQVTGQMRRHRHSVFSTLMAS